MKKILFFILFSFGFSCYSQNLTLEEIVSLRKKDLANVEEFLSDRGWSFISGSEAADGVMGRASFAYNKNQYNDFAESFFAYFYSSSGDEYNRILLQISTQPKYNLYLNKIKSYGCKIIKSRIVDGEVEKVYQGKTTTFIIKISTQKGDYNTTKTLYELVIMDNFEYHVNYGE